MTKTGHIMGAMAFVAAALAPSLQASSLLLRSDFSGATAPGWVLQGNASLTGGKSDDPGDGWLRLTSNANNQTGFAYQDAALPFSYGVDLSFRYSVWGGTGADGFALVFFDGSVAKPVAGAYGGSLGYAQRSGVPGLRGAILGIGFDEFGNFSNPTEGRQGGAGFLADSITVRGPGDGTWNAVTSWGATNYGYLFTTGNLPGRAIQAMPTTPQMERPEQFGAERETRIVVDTSQVSSGHLPISVYLTRAGSRSELVAEYDAYEQVVAYYGGVENLPETFKFGFTGSTGGSTNYHEIQGLRVASVEAAPGFDLVETPEPSSSLLLAGGIMILAGRLRRGARS